MIIQQELMSIATQLANDRAYELPKKGQPIKTTDKDNIIFLENQIDLISRKLPELKIFYSMRPQHYFVYP